MDNTLKQSDFRELFLWLIRRRRRFRVSGESMTPLLKPGDEVLIDQNAYRKAQPQPGDIVVARHPYRSNLRMIKRVTAITENKRIFLIGDNPPESTDSRSFGPVEASALLGRVTSLF